MIELGKTYKDRSGNDVRIICVDHKGGDRECPVIGLRCEGDYECIRTYQGNGMYASSGSIYDLILPEDYSTYVDGEPVMVRDRDEENWRAENFAGVLDGKAATWSYGTMWASRGARDIWNQCRRPTAEELGEK